MKHLLLVSLLTMSFFHLSGQNAEPDFRYPKTVAANAETQLSNALRKGDGDNAVDALIRYSLAQSAITQENAPQILRKIAETRQQVTAPDIRALLSVLQARVTKAYQDRTRWERRGRTNPTDALPDDIAEWDDAQFNARIQELLNEALGQEEALQNIDVRDRNLVIVSDENSHDYLPRLLDFLYNEAVDMSVDDGLRRQWYARWQQANAGSIVPAIYLEDRAGNPNEKVEYYHRYADHEESGLLLSHTVAEEETYPLYQEYLRRYPRSRHTAAIRNLIQMVERKYVQLSYAGAVHPSQTIGVKALARNVREAEALLFRITDEEYKKDSWQISLKGKTPLATQPLSFPEHQPWEERTGKATFEPLAPGYYVIVPRFKVGNAWQMDRQTGRYTLLRVSAYALFASQSNPEETLLFTVDSKTGEPRAGVPLDVKINRTTFNLTTGREGCAPMKVDDKSYQNYTISVPKAEDHYTPELSFTQYPTHESAHGWIEVFTDLAIYRPGEKVRFTAVAYEMDSLNRRLLSGREAEVILRDPNGETVETKTFTTDANGQITGEFGIPTDRINGDYDLRVKIGDIHVAHEFDVSEYKTPTFFISMEDTRDSYDTSQPVVIRGKVETYTGLPLADQEVQLLVSRTEWSWFMSVMREPMADAVVRTAADGSFQYTVPAEVIAREQVTGDRPRWCYPRYRWTVNARLTDAGGETQEAAATFVLGRIREIAWSGSTDIMIQEKILRLPLVYRSSDENDLEVSLSWQLFDADNTTHLVAQGEFMSSNPVVKTASLKSGRYLLRVVVKDDRDTAPLEQNIILYRENDNRCHAASSLWIPEASRRLEKNKMHVLIGTDRETHIWYVAQSHLKVEAQGWLHYTPGLHHFTMLMPEGLDESLTVDFITVSDFQTSHERIRMLSPQKESITLALTSFRDRLVPGQSEEWTFTVRNQEDKPAQAQMILELYDQALQDLANNRWMFNVGKWSRDFVRVHRWDLSYITTDASWQQSTRSDFNIIEPRWNLYDHRFFTERGIRAYGRMMYKSAAAAPLALNAEADGVAVEEDAALESMDTGEAVQGATAVSEKIMAYNSSAHTVELLQSVPLRQGEIKVALWEPSLSVGEDGTCVYRFKAPESNATWALQAIAFNRRVMTSGISRTLVTQRPVMVQPKLPRFVRTGDEIRLEALVQNATDTVLSARYEIEVFDPFTNEAIAVTAGRKNGAVEIAPKASVPVGVSVRVPSGLARLAFRIKAADTAGNGDGEQQALPVLPNVSPVVETLPFYMQPAEDSLSMAVPAWPADAKLTLEVCANPIWYAVLALPVIADGDYVTATSLAHNLFALCLAEGLVKDNPRLAEAIHHWTENNARDSVLVSQLEKNADLKITSLQASPWLPEARRQTERMSRLEDLTDSVSNAATRRQVLGKLKDLQQADGGIAWFRCGYLRSSYWATETLLQLVGELHGWGYAKDDETLTELCHRAIRYYDSETVRLRDEMKRYGGKVDYAGFAAYAYTRSLWPEYDHKGEARKIADRAVSEVSRRWGEQSLVSRAYTALTLHNRGENPKQAQAIVESLRQHALTKSGQGMYWDGIRWGGYRWWNPVTLTSVMLQTFRKVDPRTDETDAIRQWLLLEKKTTDWGNSSLAADAVTALMTCGTRWETGENRLDVRLGGQPVTFPSADRYLGYSRVEVSDAAGGKTLSVNKQGNAPAWGSLYAQYESPMSQTAAARTQELSVTKELLRYQPDGSTVHPDMLTVGDKVQVRLVIRNERDLEYVSLVDERGACFEPTDQLSDAVSQDGLYYYRETKDSETRLFFDRLPKGTHVFTWDLNVTHGGQFAVGVATVQCQYSPDQTAHSEAAEISVNR